MSLDLYFKKTVLALHFDNIADPFASYAVASSTCESSTPAMGTLYAASVGYGTYAGRTCASLRTYSSAYYGVYGASTGVFNGDFTLEFWFHPVTNITSNTLGGGIAGTTNTYGACSIRYTAAGLWDINVRGGPLPSFTFSPTLNEWHHFVITSEAGTVTVFIDGVRRQSGTIANNTSYNTTNGFRIGYTPGMSTGYDGYASDLRLYKGAVKYPFAGFTPPDWPLPPPAVHYDIANSKWVSAIGSALNVYTAGYKFGGGCLYLDGASYAECPASADWNFGTGDFTVEAWVKRSAGGSRQAVVGQWNNTTDNSWSMHIGPSNDLAFFTKDAAFDHYTGTGGSAQLPAGEWVHCAASRQGDTLRLFLNGELKATNTSFAGYSVGVSGTVLRLGRAVTVSDWFTGYVDDVRITKGVARYTENFTPPAQAFPDGQAVVSGVVYDSGGNLCSRRVFVHSRATGRLLGTAMSDPVTGVYEIAAEEECYVVCLDSTGSYNAKVIDGVDPTA